MVGYAGSKSPPIQVLKWRTESKKTISTLIMNTKNDLNASSQEKISEEGQSALTAEKTESLGESLGLHVEVDNPKTGKIKVAVSERVALKLGPWGIVAICCGILISGLYFSGHNIPHLSPPPPPTTELQPQK
jgi:hypothetical protein